MSKARILIVEDVQRARLDLKTTVERLGYVVAGLAGTGEEAIEQALLLRPDLILMDIQLQGALDGITAAARIQKYLDVSIIYLTAYADDGTLERARATGAYGYVLKPIVIGTLKVSLATALERFRLDRRMREDEQWLLNLVGSLGDAVVATDNQGQVIFVNPVAEELLGWPRGEALGKPLVQVFRVLDRDTRQPLTMLEERVLRDGQPTSLPSPCLLIRRDDTECLIDDSAAPVRDASGQSVGMVVVFRDVSERQRLAEKLRQMQKMEAVGRLAGGVAHDFNNLLTVILGYTEQAREHPEDTAAVVTALTAIEQAGRRAAGLTRQLLAFGRRHMMAQRLLDLKDLLKGMADVLKPMLGEATTLHLALPSECVRALADPVLFEQILVTLASNASDAMPGGGELFLTLGVAHREAPGERAGKYARVSVRDTGAGISEEVKAHLFEPYFTTKEKGRGTGLGLAAVYGIIQQHQGLIDVTSSPGQGTTFDIYLPLVQDTSTPQAPAPAPAAPAAAARTVLLVEDEAMVRTLARKVLQTIGANVLEAANPEEALRLGIEHAEPIHLLLTDVVMPGMNGPALHEELCRHRPGLPVLYMSGYTFGALEEMGLLRPGIELMPKPFTIADFIASVQKLLNAAAPQT